MVEFGQHDSFWPSFYFLALSDFRAAAWRCNAYVVESGICFKLGPDSTRSTPQHSVAHRVPVSRSRFMTRYGLVKWKKQKKKKSLKMQLVIAKLVVQTA